MKPLSQKTRRISWAILFLVFLGVAPFVLYYSFGYRFDDTFTLVKTGGIYIHSDVANTQVFIDGKYFKNNGILLKNTLIQKLNPGEKHSVDMHKDGFHSWHKELFVVQGLVTEANALMLPTEIEKLLIYPYFDTEGNGTTTLAIDGQKFTANQDFLEAQELFDLVPVATSTISKLAIATTTEAQKIPDYFEALGVTNPELLENLMVKGDEVSWLDNGNLVMHWVGESDETPFYYCLPLECRKKLVIDWDTNISRFDFLPDRSEIALVLNADGLWAVEMDDRSERNIQPVYEGAGIDFRVSNNDRIIVLDGGVFFELQI